MNTVIINNNWYKVYSAVPALKRNSEPCLRKQKQNCIKWINRKWKFNNICDVDERRMPKIRHLLRVPALLWGCSSEQREITVWYVFAPMASEQFIWKPTRADTLHQNVKGDQKSNHLTCIWIYCIFNLTRRVTFA